MAIAAGWMSCVENARELLREAQRLIDEVRTPRAPALAILAWEELGKALLIAEAGALKASDEQRWSAFQREFRSHRAKQETVAKLSICVATSLFAGRRETVPERKIEAWLHNIHRFAVLALQMGEPSIDEIKQWSFYVRLVSDRFESPQSLPVELAECVFQMVSSALHDADLLDKDIRRLAGDIETIRGEWIQAPAAMEELVRETQSAALRSMMEAATQGKWRHVAEVVDLSPSALKITSKFIEVFGLASAL